VHGKISMSHDRKKRGDYGKLNSFFHVEYQLDLEATLCQRNGKDGQQG
jgi:hypothetical protein